MARRRPGVAERFGKDNSVTVTVFAPKYWKTASMYEDILEIVKEISKLTIFPPKYCISFQSDGLQKLLPWKMFF